jgi:hypothetical protein
MKAASLLTSTSATRTGPSKPNATSTTPAGLRGGSVLPMTEQPTPERQPMVERKPLFRRGWFWGVLVLLVLPALVFGGMYVATRIAFDGFGSSPETVDCADAMRSTGVESLPEDMGVVECEVGGIWDTYMTIHFVGPQEDVDAWLRSEFPNTELGQDPCADADYEECARVDPGGPDAPESGWRVELRAIEQSVETLSLTVKASR